MARRGGPAQPYTTAYIDGEFHFIKRLARVMVRRGETTEWEAACGKVGAVDRGTLKDRTAAEILAVNEQCSGCITMGWTYHLGREAKR
jgi:hypothetical protein